MVSKEQIFGRQEECEILNQLFRSSKPEFLAIYGRRRVGKTHLIRNFFNKKPVYFFYAVGIHNEPIDRQIKEFTKEIGRTFYQGTELKERDNWFDTFELLLETFNRQVPKNKKIVLFFDEFPWMATHRSKLLQALEYYWNRHWSQDKRIKLIICGSAASWIIKNIVNNNGGLHNRLTRTIQLEPMNLMETKQFLDHNGMKLHPQHIVQIYMVTGGIPYYLSHIDSVSSATQIIEKLAFSKNSFLLKEFNNLYSSLFGDDGIYVELVRAIAKKIYGIGQEELFHQVSRFSKGGTIVNKLKELEDAGFILSFKPYKRKKKGIYYRMIDEYSLFYFDWIEPIKETLLTKGMQKGYWQKIQKTPAWYNWAGYSFEAICYKHLVQISKALSLSPTAIPTTWRYSPVKESKETGAQVDLLFDRDDDAITLCEIKYTSQPFDIDKKYAENLKRKIEIFKKITGTRKQIFLAMISANGLKKTMYSEDIVDGGVIILDDLFTKY
jgi:uncharacterized protein